MVMCLQSNYTTMQWSHEGQLCDTGLLAHWVISISTQLLNRIHLGSLSIRERALVIPSINYNVYIMLSAQSNCQGFPSKQKGESEPMWHQAPQSIYGLCKKCHLHLLNLLWNSTGFIHKSSTILQGLSRASRPVPTRQLRMRDKKQHIRKITCIIVERGCLGLSTQAMCSSRHKMRQISLSIL